ncbi:hypothetical protein HPB50_021481 [Hyalomma asiaticum]|uniref:Uncharacterized protein n=1 Tax=Hyalomma asiaticum TaxID=266040 RepID=A0ACB7SNF4_HYAAI|nr:hypothetical protein HPB50_021481 [Hyalomma asiaticum]
MSSNFCVHKRGWSHARTSADWQGMGYRACEDNPDEVSPGLWKSTLFHSAGHRSSPELSRSRL